MKKFIFLLFFIPLGCSVESNAIQETPKVVESELVIVKNIPNKSEPVIVESLNNKNCATAPLLEIYEEFVELGIKEANLSTEKANINFEKNSIPEDVAIKKLTTEFGRDFVKDACKVGGSTFLVSESYKGGQGAYLITFNSTESANKAAALLQSLDRNNFRTNKFLTLFDWRIDDTTILINFFDQAIVRFYEPDKN